MALINTRVSMLIKKVVTSQAASDQPSILSLHHHGDAFIKNSDASHVIMVFYNCSRAIVALWLLLAFQRSDVLAARHMAFGTRKLHDVTAQQLASTSSTGTTSTSSSSSVAIKMTANSATTNGQASSNSSGNGDVFSVSKTSGFVQTGNQKFVANAAFGESGASGNSVSSDNKAWGSSGNGPSGPNATAGHTVSTNGPMTGSAGDQAVAILNQRP